MLEVRNLTKVYDDGTQALTDVSFDVEDGEFLVVIGLSGSGKSTLLRCINRLVEPTEGRVVWDGEDVTAADGEHLRRVRAKIGMIFQSFNLVRRSSVMVNVLSGRLGYVNTWQSALFRFPESDRRLAHAALERVGLVEQAHKRASELSGGQQQRVGIARALMQQPRIILADEPVASLDPVLSHTILGYLERLNREDGITVICSLHYLDLVQRYATRVIGLKDGRVVYTGSREDIRRMTDEEFKSIYGEEAQRVAATEPLGGEDPDA
ncbi:MAG: phosphonate ABC transporter ATP-binding protein [Spirochaetaceae bacterium]